VKSGGSLGSRDQLNVKMAQIELAPFKSSLRRESAKHIEARLITLRKYAT
jgi:hypothetical protein